MMPGEGLRPALQSWRCVPAESRHPASRRVAPDAAVGQGFLRLAGNDGGVNCLRHINRMEPSAM